MSKEIKEKHLPLFVVIPANVHFNHNLSDKDVRIYGYVSALANARGYCGATNRYLAETFNISERTVQRALKNLVDNGLLRSIITRNEENIVTDRKLFLVIPSPVKKDFHKEEETNENQGNIDENSDKPHNDSHDKSVMRGGDKSVRRVMTNMAYNNIINNNNINNNIYGDVDTSAEHNKKISSKKSDVEDKQSKLKTSSKKKSKIIVVDEDSVYSRIMKHFNSKDNTKFKANAKEYVENIDNLLQAYTEKEIIAVIDYVRENNYKAEYFRPSTIFRVSNFERNYEFCVRNLDTKKAHTQNVQAEHKTYYIVRTDLNKVIASPVEPKTIDSSLVFTDKLLAEAKLQELT